LQALLQGLRGACGKALQLIDALANVEKRGVERALCGVQAAERVLKAAFERAETVAHAWLGAILLRGRLFRRCADDLVGDCGAQNHVRQIVRQADAQAPGFLDGAVTRLRVDAL
jgi:hypothetical protein